MVSGIEPAGMHPIPWKSQLRILWVIRQATGSFRSASVRMELTRYKVSFALSIHFTKIAAGYQHYAEDG